MLNLHRCGLSGDELVPLFAVVFALKLTAVDLSNNNFDFEAAHAMEQGLRRCGRLKELRIAGNPLEFQVLAKYFLQGDPVNVVSSKQVQDMQSIIPQIGSTELKVTKVALPLHTVKVIASCLQCWTSVLYEREGDVLVYTSKSKTPATTKPQTQHIDDTPCWGKQEKPACV
eukprot:m.448718 g.448718  ORF g.448718 m.448718 type:complete len:171 (-) comp20315_c14_seq49:714-1226(-)